MIGTRRKQVEGRLRMQNRTLQNGRGISESDPMPTFPLKGAIS
jgi:hypothetical protein